MHSARLFAFARLVPDVEAAPVPALKRIFGFLLRVEEWPHSVVVQRVWFVKVGDVELVDLSLSSV